MGKFNFYAVAKGRIPGVYTSWEQCSLQVTGYNGALFKGFQSEQDATEFAGVKPPLEDEEKKRKAESELPKHSKVKKVCQEKSKVVRVYTDGSCSPNPGPGGWAIIVVSTGFDLSNNLIDGTFIENESSYEKETTNNRMELVAATKAVHYLNTKMLSGEIITDSQYVKNGITKWIKTWKTNGWKTADKKNVKNDELWKKLNSECEIADNNTLTIKWMWTRGHSSNQYNEMADKEANRARKSM